MNSSSPIKDPLWSLMLSCNDCYPGCSCDEDYFNISTDRVASWLKSDGMGQARKTLRQVDNELKEASEQQLKGVNSQINMVFRSNKDWLSWLDDWSNCIKLGLETMHYTKKDSKWK